MRYSHLPIKTSKMLNRDLHAKNARLLIQAGFIHQEIAGVYTFLPLGLRVLKKIEDIIREEMDKIGVETLMPSLGPIENWKISHRFESVDVLMKTTPANEKAKAKNDTEYVLNPTHEDIVTPLFKDFNRSYKDFPFAAYQIQTKFRNEPRAKSGLLRCREFRMKDLYSFHVSEADLQVYYEKSKEVYWKVFEQLGLGHHTSFLTLASGGDFTKGYSHEFQTICDSGEDIVFHVKSKNITFNREVAPSKCPIIDDADEKLKPLKNVRGEGVIGVEDLAKHLQVSPEKTIKTLIFETETGEAIVAAVRGIYDVHEEKLKKIVGCNDLKLASPQKVKEVTGAEIGYAGIINLPKNLQVYLDASIETMHNFETGTNKTNYHTTNVNFDRDIKRPEKFYDIKIAREGDLYPETGEVYEVYKTAEIGNIFPLNTKFSKAFGYKYVDENGQDQDVYMGSYGIGSSRVMGVIVEKYADEKGLVWPDNIAPFQAYLVGLDKERADFIYEKLLQNNIEVFYDDRNVSAGDKFFDADLMGIPTRLVVSKKTNGSVEWKKRTEDKKELLSLEAVIENFTRNK
ncbi:MAG TPA: proline--tRNA ligase [Candidatus Saccharimonadales bacterium]|nr:proline--tRNA ligase [Candidatus Saccharimonadales bacterium]